MNYNDRPHELRISPAFYFSTDSLRTLSQEVEQRNIDVTLHTSYGVNIGDFSLNYTPRFNMNLRQLTSSLSSIDNAIGFVHAADSLRNNLWYNTYQAGVDQEYIYRKQERIRIRLTIPTYFSLIVNDDRLASNSVSHNKWIVNPTLYADYSVTPSFKTALNAYYRKSYGNFSDAYKGYILQSYRNLLCNTSDRLFEIIAVR